MGVHSYEPRNGHGLRHDPFNAIIGPRVIGWISTLSDQGVRNIAPYSFFNAFNYHPPIIGFSSTSLKDTARNIAATGEFVWNLVTEDLAAGMNATSATVAPEVDEFGLAGLVTMPSQLVKPPRASASPVAFECRLTQQFALKDVAGSDTSAIMTFGEVVMVHIDETLLEDGVYQTTLGRPVLRGGGPGDYFTISEAAKFVMPRPK
jgi:flavin reductase (DIM6/NTAB) family NADH-FMN oxidoreductase RutF